MLLGSMTRRFLLLALLLLSASPGVAFAVSSDRAPAMDLEQPPTAALPAPDEVLGPERRKLGRGFDKALAAFEAGRYDEAADAFEALLARVEWPEASFNAGWSRYVMLDLEAAEAHAAKAVRGLPNDIEASRLHALVLHDLGRHDDARMLVRAALEQLRDEQDLALRARLELLLGATSRLLGRLTDASAAYQRALDAGSAAGQPLLKASAHLGLGHVALSRGDVAGADASFTAAKGEGGEGRSARHEVEIAAAEGAWRDGNSAVARSRLAATLGGIDEGDLPPLSKAGLEVRVAILQWNLGQTEVAQTRLDGAEKVLTRAGAKAALADVWVARSSWAVATGDLSRAAELLDRAIAAQEQVQVPVALASSRLARAQLLAEEGDVLGALALAERSREVFAEVGVKEGEQGAWLVLAELKGRGGALAEAREAALTAVGLAQKLGNPRLAASARSELAVILARMGAVDEAVAAYEKATIRPPSAESLLAPRTKVRLEVELAALLARSDRATDGLEFARRALAAAEGVGAPADLIPLGEEAMVAVLLEGGQHDEALAFLDERGVREGRLRQAAEDRRGTKLFNAAVDAYDAGDLGLAARRFRELLADEGAPEERRTSAKRALQDVLSAHGAESVAKGKGARAEELWDEASTLARDREDVVGLATLLLLRAQLAGEEGATERATALATECGEAAAELEDATHAAQCWELLGHAAFETKPDVARRGFENALAAWTRVSDSVAHRAQLAYNLAVLDQEAPAVVLRGRLEAALALAQEAQDASLGEELTVWIKQLESDDAP